MLSEKSRNIVLELRRSPVRVETSALLCAAGENNNSDKPTEITSSSLEEEGSGEQKEMCSTVGDVTVQWNESNDNHSISSQSIEDRNTVMATCHDLEVQLNVNAKNYYGNGIHGQFDDNQQYTRNTQVIEAGEGECNINSLATEFESGSQEVEGVAPLIEQQPDVVDTDSLPDRNNELHGKNLNHYNGQVSSEEGDQSSTHNCKYETKDGEDRHVDIGDIVSNLQMRVINVLFPSHDESESPDDEIDKNSEHSEDQVASYCNVSQCSEEISEGSSCPKSVAEQDTNDLSDANFYDGMDKDISASEVECIEPKNNHCRISSFGEERLPLQQHHVMDREHGGDSIEEVELSRFPADEIQNKATSGGIKSKDDCMNPDCESSLPSVADTDDEHSDTSNDSSDKTKRLHPNDLGNEFSQKNRIFDCGEMFPSHHNEVDEIDKYEVEKDGYTTPEIENVKSFHVDQICRSVDEIDGLSPNNSDEEDVQGPNIDEEGGGGNGHKLGRRVFFNRDPVSSVFELERINPEDKVNMYYTSKDLTGFRIDYILEIQEIHEKMERQRVGGSTLMRTLAAKFNEIVSCKPIIDFFCTNPNRASI